MSVRLEAHKQNDALFSTAQDSSSLIRFGELTLAFVLQILMPLLIIFLCFNAFTQEREDQTLPLMLGQGISIQQLAWGKILGFSGVVACLVVPVLLILSVLVATQTSVTFTGAWLARTALVMVSYLSYYVFIRNDLRVGFCPRIFLA